MRRFYPAAAEISHHLQRSTCLVFLRISFIVALLPILFHSTVPMANGETGRGPVPNTKSQRNPDLAGTVINRGNVRRLHISCDFGNILIHTASSGPVEYRLYLKSDAPDEKAKTLLLKN
jgi:hypothetical protein